MRPLRLFTPGPLNTSQPVRHAAAADLGSRTPAATELSKQLRLALAEIAGCDEQWNTIPLQGSGTFAVEAMLCSFIGPRDHLLILENGVYSQRMVTICELHNIRHTALSLDSYQGIDLAKVEAALNANPDITHLAAVHFETALGVLNDINALTALADRCQRQVLVDAISTFGVLPLNVAAPSLMAMALSSNKGLHGLPGVAFVLARRALLERETPPRTLSLDLKAQAAALDHSGEWRFTPPLQVMLALRQAIFEYLAQGGRLARYETYQRRMAHLLQGMAALGFTPVIDAQHRAPLIVTLAPHAALRCDVSQLNDYLFERQLVIYPTKHSDPNSFRIGVMGELSLAAINELLAAFADFITDTAADRQPCPPVPQDMTR